MEVNHELLIHYRTTWEQFVHSINELHDCAETGEPNRPSTEAALLKAEKARLAYNAARDRLVAQMSGLHPPVNPAAQAMPQDGKVRAIAHLLWEFSGRPEGTADTDWVQAERLLRSAAMAGSHHGQHEFAVNQERAA